MDEETIRQTIERVDPKGEMRQNLQEELVVALASSSKNEVLTNSNKETEEKEIRKQMYEETDWRKKAALAARLISNSLG